MHARSELAVESARAAREVFERRLERTYQQAVLSRALVEQVPDVASTARAALAAVEASLGSDDDSPMDPLCRRFELTREQRDFVWSVVACSFDARVLPHVEAIGGSPMRRGLSLSVYAQLAGLSKSAVVELAHWLDHQ